MDRVASDTTRKAIRRLWKDRLIQVAPTGGISLTDKGIKFANAIVARLM
jgi:Mn-dependent DtxR family transcriptional regulator